MLTMCQKKEGKINVIEAGYNKCGWLIVFECVSFRSNHVSGSSHCTENVGPPSFGRCSDIFKESGLSVPWL